MLTYEEIINTLDNQEDKILVNLHNTYCKQKDKIHLYIYDNTPNNVEMLLPENKYDCLLEGQYIRDTYVQTDKWVQIDEQGHIISENEAKGTLLFLSNIAVWLQTFGFKNLKELENTLNNTRNKWKKIFFNYESIKKDLKNAR